MILPDLIRIWAWMLQIHIAVTITANCPITFFNSTDGYLWFEVCYRFADNSSQLHPSVSLQFSLHCYTYSQYAAPVLTLLW